MYFIYDDKSSRGGFNPKVRPNPTKCYLTHFDNLLTLEFLAKSPITTIEKLQVEKEIKIAHRKMSYWKKVYGYDQAEVTATIPLLLKKWQGKVDLPNLPKGA